jgi:HAD superfamily hydrolase (TIGR01509 family)
MRVAPSKAAKLRPLRRGGPAEAQHSRSACARDRPGDAHATLRARSHRPTGPGAKTPEAVIRALVFDFDGLILDTETAEHQAWAELYAEHGTELPLDRWLECIGTSMAGLFDPVEQLERQLGELVDRERLRARASTRTHEILADRSTLPGVTDYIARADELGLGLAVASSSSREWVTSHLQRLGLLEAFRVIRCSDDVARVKPDPELYTSVCRALEAPPGRCIAIEDSPHGIASAKTAGLYCVSVPNALTRHLSLDAADLVLVSLAAATLDEVIERARRPACGAP